MLYRVLENSIPLNKKEGRFPTRDPPSNRLQSNRRFYLPKYRSSKPLKALPWRALTIRAISR